MKCGESSSLVNLSTKIDSVKNFQLSSPTNYSINVTWNYPNVHINEGIAHLDHYNLSYFNQSQPDLISFVSVDNSSLDYLLNNLESENDYNISICGCRTQECEEDDKGELVESSISLLFGEVTNLSCSISNSISINCNWNQPINCSIPFYYNFTYQSISQNDSGNYQPTSTNQQFTVQLQNQEYQINISSCNSNGKCGYISSTSITTLSPNQTNYDSNTTAITLGIIIPIIVISIIIIGIILFKKKKRRKQIIQEIIKENEEEKELQDNLDL
ncbi:tenascin-r [Anaeramoeba ignava]|uniref:Tenascin-r n=1 Tax=Anaeramoeba ignava TaxID=1746090 RepID=A0A9Q0LA62_ANAIG|nr:tenascin-r [Anaeramoeba ignava]